MVRAINKPLRLTGIRVLASLLTIAFANGCATAWLESYDHEQSVSFRIDNPDRDNLWDTSDTNGNGMIDEGEYAGPTFNFARLPRTSTHSSSTEGSAESINDSFNNLPPILEIPSNLHGGFRDVTTSVSVVSLTGVLPVDFDDVQVFNTGYSRISIVPYTETFGMQLASTHNFRNKNNSANSLVNNLELECSYGVRYHHVHEAFTLNATSNYFGQTNFDTAYENELLGPQVAFNMKKEVFGLVLEAGSSLMLGYNLAEGKQLGSIGQVISPGSYITSIYDPLYVQPNVFASEQENDEFASMAEVHLTAVHELNSSTLVRVGYTSLYFSDLRYFDSNVDQSLPNFGLIDTLTKDTWVSGLHASIEWRR